MRAPLTPLTLGRYPTPVELLPGLSRPGSELWVKRDDSTSPLYGGNKVRKLEHLLARAKALGKRRLVTLGAVGSHHVLATTIYGRAAGFEVVGVLVPQPRTPHVVEDLRADLAQGLVAVPATSWLAVPFAILGQLGAGAMVVPMGGSNVDGAMGYVDAARELAAQVRAGAMPEPDLVVVTVGSGGTAAGLAAGFALEGMKTKVVGVIVAEPAWVVAWLTRRLLRRCVARAAREGEAPPAWRGRLSLDARYLGAGYGHPTPSGERAMKLAAEVGLSLDATYTAKTFAATVDLVETRRAQTLLYWHTLSSAPMGPLLQGAPSEGELDSESRATPALSAEPPLATTAPDAYALGPEHRWRRSQSSHQSRLPNPPTAARLRPLPRADPGQLVSWKSLTRRRPPRLRRCRRRHSTGRRRVCAPARRRRRHAPRRSTRWSPTCRRIRAWKWRKRRTSSAPGRLRPGAREASVLRVAAREDGGDVVEHVGRADFVVAEVLDEPRLDDVDLLLRVLVDDRGDQRLQLDASPSGPRRA